MNRNVQIGLACAVLSTLLAGCGGLSVMTSALAGAIYVKSQTIERTFVAPMPQVKEACRQALTEMGFRIDQEEIRETESYLLATASEKYKVEVTFTPVTVEATRVMIDADSLPTRDKATATEILNQMAVALSAPPPAELRSSPVVQVAPAVETVDPRDGSPTATEPPPIPVIRSVEIAPPAPSTRPSARDHPPIVAVTGPSTELRASPSTGLTAGPHGMPEGQIGNGQQMFDTAIRNYLDGDFPAAIAHLRTYLATHPDGPERSGARYWLGESLYSQREYADALVQFETVLRDYPQSPDAVRALLKGAHAYRHLGETRQATSYLQTLIREHPDSREAHVARSLMAKW